MENFGGVLMVISAGILNGCFALPMKRTSKWTFENTWLIYSILGMFFLNWLIAWFSIPHLLQVYILSGWPPVIMAIGFGLLWGLANVLFGQGVSMIGISLTFPICLGLSTSLGTLIPMLKTPPVLLTPAGELTLLGVAIILVGVILCGVAGHLKERQNLADGSRPIAGSLFLRGLTVVVISGLFDPFLNFAFNFGDRIRLAAGATGAAPGSEADAIWALALLGSLIVNLTYCSALLSRNHTWRNFRLQDTKSYWGMAALMAIAWMASITLYGRGALRMGPLGGSIGWAIFYSCIILSSSLCGMGTGEWKEGRGLPLRVMWLGLSFLLTAVIVLARANAQLA